MAFQMPQTGTFRTLGARLRRDRHWAHNSERYPGGDIHGQHLHEGELVRYQHTRKSCPPLNVRKFEGHYVVYLGLLPCLSELKKKLHHPENWYPCLIIKPQPHTNEHWKICEVAPTVGVNRVLYQVSSVEGPEYTPWEPIYWLNQCTYVGSPIVILHKSTLYRLDQTVRARLDPESYNLIRPDVKYCPKVFKPEQIKPEQHKQPSQKKSNQKKLRRCRNRMPQKVGFDLFDTPWSGTCSNRYAVLSVVDADTNLVYPHIDLADCI